VTGNINAEPDYGDEPPAACSSRVFLGRDGFACGATPGHAGKHGYRLPWVTIEWDGRAERAAIAAQETHAAPGEVVHLSPRDATYVTPCCGQIPFELARTDRMTNDPSLVTCGGPEPKPAPELAAQPGLRVDWARVSEAVADRERERDEARAERDALRERAEAAEAAKRAAKGELAALENRLAQAIAAALMAERARIRELADRSGAVCTGAEGTSHYFSALLTEGPQ
jgi:hypothetical protein